MRCASEAFPIQLEPKSAQESCENSCASGGRSQARQLFFACNSGGSDWKLSV